MSIDERIIRASCVCRSWLYEWCAVIGISLATNLMAWRVTTSVDGSTVVWPWTVVVWLGFGLSALIYAQAFRKCEQNWEAQKSRSDLTDVIAWTRFELKRKGQTWLHAVFWAMVLFLGAGAALMACAVSG